MTSQPFRHYDHMADKTRIIGADLIKRHTGKIVTDENDPALRAIRNYVAAVLEIAKRLSATPPQIHDSHESQSRGTISPADAQTPV